MKYSLFTITLFLFSTTFAQTKQERKEITTNYNIEKLQEMSNTFSKKYHADKDEALRLALLNSWEVRYTKDGNLYELQRVSDEGRPIYYKTSNFNAAKSTRTNHLHNGGSLGLNVEGQNMSAYVWDGGIARATHQEYDGIGGADRFTAGGDGASLHDHSGHVMGTIIGSGFVINAKGMAPQAHGIGYDWNNDMGEVTNETLNGMLLSNHSYGPDMADLSDWVFGAYTNESYGWDAIMYSAPYYLMVVAAGNDGADNFSNGDPLQGQSAYDKLSGHAVTKNGLTIANAIDANVSNDGTLNSVTINNSSSEGPTDDLRIKPDITGNGTNVYSSTTGFDAAYSSYTGTSMSSPNVTGSLLLLQQHYKDINGSFMKAATLKGLALHTADDAGPNGPDAIWGWGLMNTKAAAQAISNNGLESIVIEKTLEEGETYSITVVSDNINPLLASISWTDFETGPGSINSGTPNDPTPVLANDLDIRVDNGTEYTPWKLTSVTTNAKGDNIVDPFERVDIENANGSYTITISHKGTLSTGTQNFSLVVTGLDSQFEFIPTNEIVEQCAPDDAIFDFDFFTQDGATTNTTFSAQNLPSGTNASFNPNPINEDGTISMTVSGLENADTGEYLIDVTAQSTTETETKQVILRIFNPSFSTPVLINPSNNETDVSYATVLEWDDDFNAENYEIEIADDAGFTNVVQSGTVNTAKFLAYNLENDITHYWRVKPTNQCASGTFSAPFQFTTIDGACQTFHYDGTATSIPDAGPDSFSTTLDVSDNFAIEDLNVFVDISHEDVGSLLISLISPEGTSVYLSTPVAECNAKNVLASFDDDSSLPIFCDEEAAIGYFGILQPSASFSSIHGESMVGTWKLDVRDLEVGTTGTFNNWSLNVCGNVVAGLDNFTISDLSLYPNPSNGSVNISFVCDDDTVNIGLYELSGRLVKQSEFTEVHSYFNEILDYSTVTEGIYIIKIENGEKITSKKMILK